MGIDREQFESNSEYNEVKSSSEKKVGELNTDKFSKEKFEISRRNFIKLALAASVGISVKIALNNWVEDSGNVLHDLSEKELSVCPRPPIGCSIRDQSGFMVRGGKLDDK
jgi:hypothetical protein